MLKWLHRKLERYCVNRIGRWHCHGGEFPSGWGFKLASRLEFRLRKFLYPLPPPLPRPRVFDVGGLNVEADDENMARVVAECFRTGEMVVGNVDDDGQLEMTHMDEGRIGPTIRPGYDDTRDVPLK